MKSTDTWKSWEPRLQLLWPDHLKNQIKFIQEDDHLPILEVCGVPFALSPSSWGLGEEDQDQMAIERAFETMVQCHAPDYWRQSTDPLVQALGWLDRRIGKRSWRQFEEESEASGILLLLNPLEQQIRQMRLHADQKLTDHA